MLLRIQLTLLVVINHILRVARYVKSFINHHVIHRWRHGQVGVEICATDAHLVMSHYRYVDGNVYTLIQPGATSLPLPKILCASIIKKDDTEHEITKEIIRMAGPHQDFHGAMLTLRDVCLVVGSTRDVLELIIVTSRTSDEGRTIFHEASFKNMTDVVVVVHKNILHY